VADIALTPQPALAGLLIRGRYGRSEGRPGLTICERKRLALVSVIGRKGESSTLAALVKSAYGIELPTSPRMVGGPTPDGRSLSFIWAGPNQWLAYAEAHSDLENELIMALGNRAMIADQSDGRCVLRISGPKAREVLAKGVPLDLDARTFRPGDVALTMAAHMGIQLWQLGETPTYEIAMFRSLAGSFWSWLTASAAEFGYEVVEER
jgi:sarcosine oxidase subunit gamma